MCIAIYNNKDLLTKKTLQNCWESNDDGAGMLWVQDGQLQVYKQLKSFKAFFKQYQAVRKITDKVVLHFRIRTHGVVDERNIHPFIVDETVGFVHNGIIQEFSYGVSEFSDTWHFNEFLKDMPKNFTKSESVLTLISEFIGSYNKLIFMSNDNDVVIVNEKAGVWDGESWFSNKSYLDPTLRYYGHQLKTTTNTTAKSTTTDYSSKDWNDYYDRMDDAAYNKSFGVDHGYCGDCGIELMTGYGDDLEAGQCAMCKGHSVAMKQYTETLF
jgi:predicted glutamine amidotransferase